MKVFHLLGCDCSQASTTVESVYACIFVFGIIKFSDTSFNSFVSKTAAHSSNRGIEIVFTGKTLVFAVIWWFELNHLIWVLSNIWQLHMLFEMYFLHGLCWHLIRSRCIWCVLYVFYFPSCSRCKSEWCHLLHILQFVLCLHSVTLCFGIKQWSIIPSSLQPLIWCCVVNLSLCICRDSGRHCSIQCSFEVWKAFFVVVLFPPENQ